MLPAGLVRLYSMHSMRIRLDFWIFDKVLGGVRAHLGPLRRLLSFGFISLLHRLDYPVALESEREAGGKQVARRSKAAFLVLPPSSRSPRNGTICLSNRLSFPNYKSRNRGERKAESEDEEETQEQAGFREKGSHKSGSSVSSDLWLIRWRIRPAMEMLRKRCSVCNTAPPVCGSLSAHVPVPPAKGTEKKEETVEEEFNTTCMRLSDLGHIAAEDEVLADAIVKELKSLNAVSSAKEKELDMKNTIQKLQLEKEKLELLLQRNGEEEGTARSISADVVVVELGERLVAEQEICSTQLILFALYADVILVWLLTADRFPSGRSNSAVQQARACSGGARSHRRAHSGEKASRIADEGDISLEAKGTWRTPDLSPCRFFLSHLSCAFPFPSLLPSRFWSCGDARKPSRYSKPWTSA